MGARPVLADGPAAATDTGSFAVGLLDELRQDVVDVDLDARRRLTIAIRVLIVAVAASLLISVGAITVALVSANTSAERVAEQVAPQVFAQLAADSRAQRLQNSRAVLDAANAALAERGLPRVADPGPDANAEQVAAAASSAQVLSVLPREIAEQLRDQTGGDVLVLPQPDGTIIPPASGGSTAPERPGGTAPETARPGSPPARPGPTTGPSSRQQPPPAPPRSVGPPVPPPPAPPRDDGLLPRLIPGPRLLEPLLSA
ncbi:hypothetical protein GCM10009613_61330 [Pseudonocardia kongjuensis]|uniref:Uncharacterized protein n=1 Tax=Pseudonocardia kongjuensis TaxID=102227 RepID=A0ABN1YA35_9PSEU